MKKSKGRIIGYWIATALVVLSQAMSGVLDLMGHEEVLSGIVAFGYPTYLLYILGVAKLSGVVVLAAPGLTRLKEWAGFAIDLGASSSHASPPAKLCELFDALHDFARPRGMPTGRRLTIGPPNPKPQR